MEAEGAQLSTASTIGLSVAVVAVVAVAGVMSGLTLGLLSLDRLELEVMMRTGNRRQTRLARQLLPLIDNPNWVLSALVICNTAASMALPLCLDRLVNVAVALVLSTTAIVLFGEILPQAVCSRYGLSIGGYSAPVVRLLMLLTGPISWPIAKALDWLLGKESPTFGKRQMRAFVDLHRTSSGLGGPLNEEEATVIQGVLDLGTKSGAKAMTQLDKVFMLSTEDTIDRALLKKVLESGHSRVPVCRGDNRRDIVGLILVKELLGQVSLALPGSGPVQVRSLRMRDLPALPVDTPLPDLLNLFQTGHSHMALLYQMPGQAASVKASTLRSARSSSSSSGSDSDSASLRSDTSSVASEGGSPHSPKSSKRLHAFLTRISSIGRKSGSGRTKSRLVVAGGSSGGGGGDAHRAAGDQLAAPAQGSGEAAGSDAVVIELPLSPPASADSWSIGAAAAAATAAAAAGTADARRPPDGAAGATPVLVAPASIAAGAQAAATPVTLPAAAAAAAGGATGLSHGGAGSQPPPGLALHAAAGLAAPLAPLAAPSVGLAATGAEPVGIITLEDVLEELLCEEILDETDNFIDNQQSVRANKRVLLASLPPPIRRLLMASQRAQQMLFEAPAPPAVATTAAAAAAAATAAGSQPAQQHAAMRPADSLPFNRLSVGEAPRPATAPAPGAAAAAAAAVAPASGL